MGPYITSTVTYLAQPIADHVVNLLDKDEPRVSDIDDVISIILLSVAMFEAYMVRARYLKLSDEERGMQSGSLREKVVKENNKKEPSGRMVMRKNFAGYGDEQLSKIDEVYILRDMIMHNHLWEYYKDANGNKSVTRRLFGGDRNFEDNVDFDRRPITTRKCAFPVVPGEQTRESARVSFGILWSALEFAAKQIPNLVQSEHITVRAPIKLIEKLFHENPGHTIQLHRLVEAL